MTLKAEADTADRVREAENILRQMVEDAKVVDTSSLLKVIAERLRDQSIGRLALWSLVTRGELEFASHSRQKIRKAS